MNKDRIFARLNNMTVQLAPEYKLSFPIELASGLQDVNNEMIYEGDVIRISNPQNKDNIVGLVVWLEEYACFAVITEENDTLKENALTEETIPYSMTFREIFSPKLDSDNDITPTNIEIIGTIRDYPEYLALAEKYQTAHDTSFNNNSHNSNNQPS